MNRSSEPRPDTFQNTPGQSGTFKSRTEIYTQTHRRGSCECSRCPGVFFLSPVRVNSSCMHACVGTSGFLKKVSEPRRHRLVTVQLRRCERSPLNAVTFSRTQWRRTKLVSRDCLFARFNDFISICDSIFSGISGTQLAFILSQCWSP